MFPASWLQVSGSAVPHGGIWNSDLLVTWESHSVTERTISVCDNHTEQRGFIGSMTGCPSPEPTSAWLHDDLSRFSTVTFSSREKGRCRAKSDSATCEIVVMVVITMRGNWQEIEKVRLYMHPVFPSPVPLLGFSNYFLAGRTSCSSTLTPKIK